MNEEKSVNFESCLKALVESSDTLSRISETCCMPERSPQMTEAFGTLRKAVNELEEGSKNQESLSRCMENIAHCGSQIGRLYVSCCTETREPLYQDVLKKLNLAHENAGKLRRLSR